MLPISRADAVLDIGCGKGGAMITLAQFAFERVDGLEISPKLAHIARLNIRRLDIPNAAVFCADAADFTDIDPYTYIYMYNPFPEIVMRRVLDNILLSLKRRQRLLTMIYKNPVFDSLVLCSGFHKIHETQQIHPDYPPFSVYVANGVSSSAS